MSMLLFLLSRAHIVPTFFREGGLQELLALDQRKWVSEPGTNLVICS